MKINVPNLVAVSLFISQAGVFELIHFSCV